MRDFLPKLPAVILLIVVGGGSNLYSQYLVSSQSLGMRSIAELELELNQPVRTGVSLFKITYMTSDVHGLTDTASGLLVLPEISLNDALPMVIYQHGTTNGPMDVPSRLAAGSNEAFAYGAMGYVTIAADYLGLGDHVGFHPYVHAKSQASAALDLLFAVTEWIEVMTGEGWIGDLFVSGYSQGGHAAAAIQKELEDNWSLVYPVTASTPMSGPYSLSGVMYDRIISDEIYYSPAYIAYITLAYQEAYGNFYSELSDFFKPAYIPIIENFRNHVTTTTSMNFALVFQIYEELGFGTCRPKTMFKDSVLQAIIGNENHPFRVALRDNDLYDWTPQAPTRLYYCTSDEQVPYQNSIVADSVMRINGATDIASVNFGMLSHSGCATPAIEASIAFFDSFVIPSATNPRYRTQDMTIVSPNPASGVLKVASAFMEHSTELRITDISGTTVLRIAEPLQPSINISLLSSGVYIVHASQGDKYYQQKVVIFN
ncbi:MAG TPA: T9SS type A sorting domain-containing protein [Saprospiraceae bacterium]|nr:T9SS type A sorting domain-containing protein [Saprospiraceae bacterium]